LNWIVFVVYRSMWGGIMQSKACIRLDNGLINRFTASVQSRK
jgi:hypothetical protein